MVRDDARPAGASDDPLSSRRARMLVLGGLAVVGILGALLLAFDRQSQDQWGCRSIPIDDGAATGATAQAAVDAFLATGIAPNDGWASSEPNRYARSVDGTQMVIDLNQSDPHTYTVVRLDTCGPGIPPH